MKQFSNLFFFWHKYSKTNDEAFNSKRKTKQRKENTKSPSKEVQIMNCSSISFLFFIFFNPAIWSVEAYCRKVPNQRYGLLENWHQKGRERREGRRVICTCADKTNHYGSRGDEKERNREVQQGIPFLISQKTKVLKGTTPLYPTPQQASAHLQTTWQSIPTSTIVIGITLSPSPPIENNKWDRL